jgi:hypothetical protein
VSSEEDGRIITDGPYQGFALTAERVPVYKTTPGSDFTPLSEGGEVDILLGSRMVRMRPLGGIEPFGFQAYVEAYTHASALRYAIVVNPDTPHAVAYVVEGPMVERSWALGALKEIVDRYVRYYRSQIHREYLRPFLSELQQIVTHRSLGQFARTAEPFDDPQIRHILGHINLFIGNLTESLNGGEEIENDWLVGGMTVDLIHGTVNNIDHALIEGEEATKLDIPAGTYSLLTITLEDEFHGPGQMSEHYTVIYRGHDWTVAPFDGEAAVLQPQLTGAEPSHLETLMAVRSLEQLGNSWQPTLREVLSELIRS